MDLTVKVSAQLTQQVKALRKTRGLSQAALGRRLGVSQARVAEIEAAPGLVGLDQWLKILSVLDVELVLRPKDPPRTERAQGQDIAEAAPKGRW